jgi:hypothetical protein
MKEVIRMLIHSMLEGVVFGDGLELMQFIVSVLLLLSLSEVSDS